MHFCIPSCILAALLPTPPLSDVQKFLQDLRLCLSADEPDIHLKNRPGNAEFQSLLELNIKTLAQCIPYLEALTTDKFSHHQKSDYANEAAAGRHLWIFGILVGRPPKPSKTNKSQKAAYVKIQMGFTALQAICVSFHRPTGPLNFPFSSPYQLEFDAIYYAKP